MSADENRMVPSWGKLSGQAAAYLVIGANIGTLFGLIPQGAAVPIFLLGGVILFPVFTFGIGVAFSSSGD